MCCWDCDKHELKKNLTPRLSEQQWRRTHRADMVFCTMITRNDHEIIQIYFCGFHTRDVDVEDMYGIMNRTSKIYAYEIHKIF